MALVGLPEVAPDSLVVDLPGLVANCLAWQVQEVIDHGLLNLEVMPLALYHRLLLHYLPLSATWHTHGQYETI